MRLRVREVGRRLAVVLVHPLEPLGAEARHAVRARLLDRRARAAPRSERDPATNVRSSTPLLPRVSPPAADASTRLRHTHMM